MTIGTSSASSGSTLKALSKPFFFHKLFQSVRGDPSPGWICVFPRRAAPHRTAKAFFA